MLDKYVFALAEKSGKKQPRVLFLQAFVIWASEVTASCWKFDLRTCLNLQYRKI